MKLLKRILGICETSRPARQDAWSVANRRITIHLTRAPELAKPGGAVRLEGARLPERVLVVHGSDGKYHALSNRCTHMGRRLDPLQGAARIQCCSVLKSTFTYEGQVVSGVARKPVQSFPVTLEGDRLVIDLG